MKKTTLLYTLLFCIGISFLASSCLVVQTPGNGKSYKGNNGKHKGWYKSNNGNNGNGNNGNNGNGKKNK